MNPFFSIIVVCLNAGVELEKTVESIANQSFREYEIIVKDGGSTDDSLSVLDKYDNICFFKEPDRGIYDAMNQAADRVKGRYVLFLNCGDYFCDEHVLERVHGMILESGAHQDMVFYGNIYERKTGNPVSSNPKLDAFGCYRNVPCHQCCFYPAGVIRPMQIRNAGRERTFRTEYAVRADYEHFLWCFFELKMKTQYLPVTVCSYAGGGFSETPENRKRSKAEHKKITKEYMSFAMRFRYRAVLLLTLAPLRSRLAESKRFSAWYQSMKRILYKG